MQFHASKVVSALILLNTTICIAMQRSIGYDPYKIEIESATCENRVYSKLQISFVIIGGLQSIGQMQGSRMELDAVRYKPQPTEAMPSNEKFYVSELRSLGRNGPTDMVVFSSSGLFAKVVTRVVDSQGLKYKDCVGSQATPSPLELQPLWGPGQNSRGHDSLGNEITSVSCEGRSYRKRQIIMAINDGMKMIAQFTQLQVSPDVMQYKPKPTEVMPLSQEKFYYSQLKKLRPNQPVDMVVFSASGKFAKVVTLKEDSDVPYYKDCVSLSNRQSPERPQVRMGSPERSQLRMGSPERSQMRMKSPERENFQ